MAHETIPVDQEAVNASPSRKVQIYVLHDDKEFRYVGKAVDAQKRLKSHLRDSRRRDTPVYRWIRKLAKNGQTPNVWVWTECHESNWPEVERKCIALARQMGWRLLNVADGGDQPKCDIETRRENGRKSAIARASTEAKKRLWHMKLIIGQSIKVGTLSERAKSFLREAAIKCPDKFGEYANL